MNALDKLPKEIASKVMALLREVDGGYEIVDMMALANFIMEHGKDYPVLFDLIQVNEDALVKHYQETGEVPPGVKLVKKTTHQDSNITELEVLRGPINPKS